MAHCAWRCVPALAAPLWRHHHALRVVPFGSRGSRARATPTIFRLPRRRGAPPHNWWRKVWPPAPRSPVLKPYRVSYPREGPIRYDPGGELKFSPPGRISLPYRKAFSQNPLIYNAIFAYRIGSYRRPRGSIRLVAIWSRGECSRFPY